MNTRIQLGLTVLLAFFLAPLLSAQSTARESALESETRIERSLLELDLEQHDQLRRREKAYRNQIVEIEKQIDSMLDQEPFALEELEILDDTLSSARRAAHGVANRAEDVRREIYGRWRRIALLDLELEGLGQTIDRVRDPISGEWTVQFLPTGQTGRFDLSLDGTLVRGTYELAGSFWGSLRGTFVGGTLRLDRIDSRTGFDLVLEGTISKDRQRIDGTWVATLLNGGGPGSGHWSIQRGERPAEDEE